MLFRDINSKKNDFLIHFILKLSCKIHVMVVPRKKSCVRNCLVVVVPLLISAILITGYTSMTTSISSVYGEDQGVHHRGQEGGQESLASDYLWNGENIYLEAANSLSPVTDKVTTHRYQIMYGKFLLPYYHQHPNMKMLEIGLGCDMGYGPGASVNLYKKLFPQAELWEAEYNAACVEKHRDGMLVGIHLLTGDQGNNEVLDGWIEQSGGQFDVVIDDGGHHNCQIWNSFQKLWPTVKPGGLYFIEDMQVAKWGNYRKYQTASCNQDLIVPEKLKDIVDDLMYDMKRKSDVKFIFCQSEACVLGKK